MLIGCLQTIRRLLAFWLRYPGTSPAHWLTSCSNDEADVVDRQFTTNLIEWLGFDEGDIVYNRTASGGKSPNRPDFRVLVLGGLAFVVEDKSTDETFDEGSIDQLRRYTAGTSGYCLWTNARTVLGLRFDAAGGYRRLVEVRVDETFSHQPGLFPQEANLSVLETLFQRSRFAGAASLLASIAVDETAWRQHARSLTDGESIRSFISESNLVLGQLATAARARLVTTAAELEEATEELRQNQLAYLQIVDDLLRQLNGVVPAPEHAALGTRLRDLSPVLAEIDVSQVEPGLRPETFASIRTIWNSGIGSSTA